MSRETIAGVDRHSLAASTGVLTPRTTRTAATAAPCPPDHRSASCSLTHGRPFAEPAISIAV